MLVTAILDFKVRPSEVLLNLAKAGGGFQLNFLTGIPEILTSFDIITLSTFR